MKKDYQKKSSHKKVVKTDHQSKSFDFLKKPYIPFLIVFFFPVLLYLQTLSFGYTFFDDDDIILNNISFFSDFSNAPNAFLTDAFIGKSSSFYRPIQTLSYMIDIQLSGGNNAWMYHLTNVILIGLISCTLLMVLQKLSISLKPALIATLIYAAHPLFVSSIAWIPARGDLQLTLFSLLSFSFLIDFLKSRKNKDLILHWIAFMTALLCKETAMFLPFIFASYFFCFRYEKKIHKKYIVLIFLYAISGIFLYLLRLKAIGGFSNQNDYVGIVPALLNLQTIPESIAMFFVPINIVPFPSYSVFKTMIGIVVIIGLLAVFIKRKNKTYREKIFGLSWFVILLLPTMVYKNQHIDYLNHRFSLPLIGVLFFLLFIIPEKWPLKNNKWPTWIYITVILIFSAITLVKSRTYKDPMTFYNASIEMNPNSALAYFNRGCLKEKKKSNLQSAIDDYCRAIELNPKYVKVYNNRGIAYGAQGLSEKAITDFSKAIELKPDYAEAYSNRAGEYFKQKKFPKALMDYSKAIELKPDFAVAYYNRANVYKNQDQTDSAIFDYSKSIEFKPDYMDAFYNRGNLYSSLGQYEKAIADYTSALKIKPDNADALYNRGVAYNAMGSYDNAIADYSKIIEINPNDVGALFNRGNTYYSKGLMDDACADFMKAKDLGLQDAADKVNTYCK